MFDTNIVVLTGRLTRDPELTYTQNNYAICNFSIAVNRGKKKDSEEEYPAFFFNCFAWGKTGENIQKFFSKGRKILITGSLEHQTWESEDGSKRSTVKPFFLRQAESIEIFIGNNVAIIVLGYIKRTLKSLFSIMPFYY